MNLPKKLRVDLQEDLWVINAPANVADVLPGIPIRTKAGKEKPTKQLLLFAYNSSDLYNYLPELSQYIRAETVFWICYPKQSGAIQSDLIKMQPWEFVFELGFRGQTSISVNNDWTGMRFTNAPRKKPSPAELPPEERNIEGIDFVKRTTVLPADAKAVLSKYIGLEEFFDSMAFSHRKEYIMAIAEAKRPETRARRIEKMAEMILKLKEEKELKNKAKDKAK